MESFWECGSQAVQPTSQRSNFCFNRTSSFIEMIDACFGGVLGAFDGVVPREKGARLGVLRHTTCAFWCIFFFHRRARLAEASKKEKKHKANTI